MDQISSQPEGHQPCPFCGGAPRLIGASLTTYDFVDFWYSYIECEQCEAQSHAIMREHGDDQNLKISETWNRWDRRADVTAPVKASFDEPVNQFDGQFKISDLAWQKHEHDGEITYVAEHPFGKYAAWVKNDVARLVLPDSSKSLGVGKTITDAFECARRDVIARLKLVIEPL